MYPNRPSNKPVMITGIVMAAVVAGLFTLNFVMKKTKASVETEAAKHSVLIYKSADGSIEYDKKLFSKEDDEKLMLSVTPQSIRSRASTSTTYRSTPPMTFPPAIPIW